jgi:NYN domain
MSPNTNAEMAVFIDGENIPAKFFEALMIALRPYSAARTIRVFGDFTNPAHRDWTDVCRTQGLEAVLHLPSIAGKNGTDMLMTIAAMDVLATGNFNTIVLVSDDSDFVPLARRLRAGGMNVIGAGVKPNKLSITSNFSQWVFFNPPAEPKRTPVVKIKSQSVQKLEDIFPSEKFRKALLTLLKDDALTLSCIGKTMRTAYPEIAASVGKNKLKLRIKNDAHFRIDGDKVFRTASKAVGFH